MPPRRRAASHFPPESLPGPTAKSNHLPDRNLELQQDPTHVRALKLTPFESSDANITPTHPSGHNQLHVHNRSSSTETVHGLDILGNKVKKLQQVIRELRDLGVEAGDTPLPRICVVGDQSVGKSSLVEGMSRIKVPRSAGTCTRCPLEINLSETELDQPWRCRIWLLHKYAYDPEPHNDRARNGHFNGIGPTADRPLGPWRENDLRDPSQYQIPFIELQSESEEGVGKALSLAQLALLNPSTPEEIFRPRQGSNPPRTLQVQFSPNVVKLDISGPNLPNLSFFDLPGVVSQDEDPMVPELTRNLAKEYIKQSSTIILLAMTMNHDAANSAAAGIVRSCAANTRTVGVLTKPDLLRGDGVEEWKSILEDRRHPLGYGYFVVKNNINPSVDHDTARVEEEAFFKTDDLFTGDLISHAEKFGTKKLQAFLAQKLTDAIAHRRVLPRIDERINKRALAVRNGLNFLPKPPGGNVSLFVKSAIEELRSLLQARIDGGNLEYTFFTKWHDMAKGFRSNVCNSHAKLVLDDPKLRAPPIRDRRYPSVSESPPAATQDEPINLDSGDEVATVTAPASSLKRRREENDSPNKRPEKRVFKSKPPTYDIASIRSMMSLVNTGLPGARSPKVTEKMHRESTLHWEKLATKFLDQTQAFCKAMIGECFRSAFGQWTHTELFRSARLAAIGHLQEAVEEQRSSTLRMINMETCIMTLDAEAKSQIEQSVLDELKERRNLIRRERFKNDILARKRSGQVSEPKLNQEDAKTIDRRLLNEPDECLKEIEEMATAKGYYLHSASRFCDNVALAVRTELFPKIRDGIYEHLTELLRIEHEDANEHYKRLLTVDPAKLHEREERLREQRMLEEATAKLKQLFASDGKETDAFADEQTLLAIRRVNDEDEMQE